MQSPFVERAQFAMRHAMIRLIVLLTVASALALSAGAPKSCNWVLISPTLRKPIGVYPTKKACLKTLGPLLRRQNSPTDTRCVPEHNLLNHKPIAGLPVMVR
jgi:hypothetical protein